MMSFGVFTAVFRPIFDIIASVFSMLATAFKSLGPVFEGISQFIVWYIQTFFTGLGVILRNLSTLAVVGAMVFGTGLYIQHKNAKDCREEVAKQKLYDAQTFNAYLKSLRESGKLRDTARYVAPKHTKKKERYQW
jgi:hypothetical protein